MTIETLKSPNPRNRNTIFVIKSKFLSDSSIKLYSPFWKLLTREVTSYWHADCTTDFLGDTFPSLIIPFSGFRSWCRNIRPSLRCPCTIDWQFSRPAPLIFRSGASRPIGNIHTHRIRVEQFSWSFRAGLPSPLACLPLACPFFLGPATQATSSAFCGFKSECTEKSSKIGKSWPQLKT